MNSEMPLHADGRPGRAGKHQVDDVLGELVVAAADPHLVAADPVGAVRLALGARGDVAQRRAGLGLAEAHGAEVASLEHRGHPAFDLIRRGVREQQVRVRPGEERVAGGSHVRGREPHARGLRDHRRQAGPTHLGRQGHPTEPRPVERSQGRSDLVVDTHPRPVERRLLHVAAVVVRSEPLGGDLLGELQHRVDGLAVVLAERVAGQQRVQAKPLVQQEVEVSAGQQERRHRFLESDRRCGTAVRCGAGVDGLAVIGQPVGVPGRFGPEP